MNPETFCDHPDGRYIVSMEICRIPLASCPPSSINGQHREAQEDDAMTCGLASCLLAPKDLI